MHFNLPVGLVDSSVTSPDPDPSGPQSSSSQSFSTLFFLGVLAVGGGLVGGMYTGVIRSSSPDPDSGSGGHSSSSSPLHPDPAPLKTKSSSTPGKPDAGVWKIFILNQTVNIKYYNLKSIYTFKR